MFIKEEHPTWDESKRAIVGGAPQGCFRGLPSDLRTPLQAEWWRMEDSTQTVVGFGWIDSMPGRAEVSLVICAEQRSQGHGRELLHHMETVIRGYGHQEVVGVVDCDNPEAEQIIKWLAAEGYALEVAVGFPVSVGQAVDASQKRTDVTARKRFSNVASRHMKL